MRDDMKIWAGRLLLVNTNSVHVSPTSLRQLAFLERQPSLLTANYDIHSWFQTFKHVTTFTFLCSVLERVLTHKTGEFYHNWSKCQTYTCPTSSRVSATNVGGVVYSSGYLILTIQNEIRTLKTIELQVIVIKHTYLKRSSV